VARLRGLSLLETSFFPSVMFPGLRVAPSAFSQRQVDRSGTPWTHCRLENLCPFIEPVVFSLFCVVSLFSAIQRAT